MGGGGEAVSADTVVGRLFVEALNAGLARARAASRVPVGTAGPTAAARLPADPFATAVLVSFDAALPSALAPGTAGTPPCRRRCGDGGGRS